MSKTTAISSGGILMVQDNTSAQKCAWQESSHASLCLLGSYLREQSFFQPLETRLHLQQKALKYTPVQKLEMLFVSLLAGAKAVSHTNFTLRADPALYRAFGLPGCAEQSVLADTLDRSEEHTSELQSHSFISYAV